MTWLEPDAAAQNGVPRRLGPAVRGRPEALRELEASVAYAYMYLGQP